jgi:hypothetical protein
MFYFGQNMTLPAYIEILFSKTERIYKYLDFCPNQRTLGFKIPVSNNFLQTQKLFAIRLNINECYIFRSKIYEKCINLFHYDEVSNLYV